MDQNIRIISARHLGSPPVTTGLVLFDIDGTLLRNGNGVHGRAIIQAATEVTGHDIKQHFGGIDAGGRTDRYIVSELLRRCGLTDPEVADAFPQIAERSVVLTREGLTSPDPAWVLAGSRELLAILQHEAIPFGLVTGNLPEVARIKLSCAELWAPFAQQVPFITGFGDVSEDRNDLSSAAFAQAQAQLNESLQPRNVVIVGDTPRDVACAHAIGARCIAVATGRYDRQELQASHADLVVSSLSELDLGSFGFM